MKRVICILLVVVIVFVCIGCGTTNISAGSDVVLNFNNSDENIHVTLTDTEAEMVARILRRNFYDPRWAGVPSCGFSEEISLAVNDRAYAIACDDCNYIMDCTAQRFFRISQRNMDDIRALFEKYGGYFPCV